MQDLSDRYPVWLCDVWGVVHDGVESFPPALDALRRHRRNGGVVILVTNAPRRRGDIAQQLGELHVDETCYDTVVTSGDATRELVSRHAGGNVFHLGPERDTALIAGLDVGFGPLERADAVLCTGLFDDTVESPDDYRDLLARIRARDLNFICANPDRIVRRGSALIYCAGALAERYAVIGGRVVMAGKPHPPIYELARVEAGKHLGKLPDKSQMLAVGDGPETDIAGAAAFGIDALLIAGGISHGHAPDELAKAVGERIPGARIVSALAELKWG